MDIVAITVSVNYSVTFNYNIVTVKCISVLRVIAKGVSAEVSAPEKHRALYSAGCVGSAAV